MSPNKLLCAVVYFSNIWCGGSRLGQGSFNRLYLCLPLSVFKISLSTIVRLAR